MEETLQTGGGRTLALCYGLAAKVRQQPLNSLLLLLLRCLEPALQHLGSAAADTKAPAAAEHQLRPHLERGPPTPAHMHALFLLLLLQPLEKLVAGRPEGRLQPRMLLSPQTAGIEGWGAV